MVGFPLKKNGFKCSDPELWLGDHNIDCFYVYTFINNLVMLIIGNKLRSFYNNFLQWEFLIMQLVRKTLGIGLLMAGSLYATMAVAAPEDELAKVTEGYACTSCHKIAETGSGPSYTEVAAKYTDDEATRKMLTKRIVEGAGTGMPNADRNWPKTTMPMMTPNAEKTPGDINKILDFIFALKK